MASATYVSVLLRAHLRALTPLPKDELAALKEAVGALGAIGRNLNQMTRGREEFRAILKLCEALRDHTKGLISSGRTLRAGTAAMPKTLVELRNRPLLDIVSHGRGGPKGSVRLSADQIAAIDRTVRRVPEVMVKVLPKDGNNLRSVSRHLNYIGRYGKLELETDDGERVQGKDAGQRLLEDWDLDLDKHRKEMGLASVSGRAPKLVHKIMLSMPPGTPEKGVLEATRNFARERSLH
jgi:hypothetical protein